MNSSVRTRWSPIRRISCSYWGCGAIRCRSHQRSRHAWKRAMELAPDAYTDRLLHKAERELEVEKRSRRRQSTHFILHVSG